MFIIISVSFVLQGCQKSQKPPKELLSLADSQMKIRSFQTRVFEINDEHKVLRGVVASLQDLGFIIERANAPMGLVTAGKFAPGGRGFVELTATVRTKGKQQTEIRVNALHNTKPVEDPKVYQRFFSTVQRSLFITK